MEENSFNVGCIICPLRSWSLGFSTVVLAIDWDRGLTVPYDSSARRGSMVVPSGIIVLVVQ